MHPYAPLPRIEPQAPDEPLLIYAARVLRFVLETDTTATLTDIDLELADHVYPLAVAAAELTDATRQTLTDTRHVILAAIARRRKIAKMDADTPPVHAPALTPTNGHAVKLIPPRVPQPPAGQYADF
jgi:hypothetical protein